MITKDHLIYALEDYATQCECFGIGSWQALNSLKVYNSIKRIYNKG